MLRFGTVLLMLATLAVAPRAAADRWGTPERRTVRSPNARFELVVEPHSLHRRATLSLFSINKGKRKARYTWSAVSAWTPVSVFVSDSGRVVTMNEWGRAGFEHTLVIYDRAGRVLVDRHLDDLLLKEELPLVTESVSSRHWLYGGEPAHLLGEHLMLTTLWGRELAIDLASATIRRNPELFPNLVFFARRSGVDLMKVDYEVVDENGRLECDWDRSWSRCWLSAATGDRDYLNRNLVDVADLRGRLEPLVSLRSFVESPVYCDGCRGREELRLFFLYDGSEYSYSVVLEGDQRKAPAVRRGLDAVLGAFRFGRERDRDH